MSDGADDVDEKTKDGRGFKYVLQCPCGMSLSAPTEDEIVDAGFEHLHARHPHMVGEYEREHMLFMAIRMRA